MAIGFLSWSNPALAVKFAGPLFMVSLGLILRNGPSRLAALTLFLYFVVIAYLAFAAQAEVSTRGFSGKDIILAIQILFLYAGYKGIQGTFGFHKIHNTKIRIKSILFLSAIIFGYAILVTAIYMGMISIFRPTFESMPESLVGALGLVAVLTVILFGILGWLPGTKKMKVVQYTDKHEKNIT